MNFRQQYPDDASLTLKIDTVLPTIVDQVRQSAGPLEAAFLKARKDTERNSAYVFAGFLMASVMLIDEVRQLEGVVTWLIIIGVTLLGLLFIYLGIRGFRKKKVLRDGMTPTMLFRDTAHRVIFMQAMQVLGITDAVQMGVTPAALKGKTFLATTMGRYGTVIPAPETESVKALLDHSELITEDRNTLHIDDMISFTVGTAPVFVAEMDVKHVTGSGKNKNTKFIFHGLFVCFDLKRACTGKTFVSTDGDRDGIGHQSFWSRHIGGDVQETTLEWNEFEDLLHVATSDPVEARYILTPDFMHELYVWWKDKKANIRISFIGTRLYILCPSQEVSFFKTIEAISESEVRREVLAIARPLLPILHLLEIIQQEKL